MILRTVLLGLLSVATLWAYYSVFDFFDVFGKNPNELPKGELVKEVPSPNGNSLIRMYLVEEGGATSRFQMRGEVVYPSKETKTIYFNYDEDRTEVQWIDKETVVINDEKLNTVEDFYYWKDDPEWEEKRGEKNK